MRQAHAALPNEARTSRYEQGGTPSKRGRGAGATSTRSANKRGAHAQGGSPNKRGRGADPVDEGAGEQALMLLESADVTQETLGATGARSSRLPRARPHMSRSAAPASDCNPHPPMWMCCRMHQVSTTTTTTTTTSTYPPTQTLDAWRIAMPRKKIVLARWRRE